MDRYLAGHTLVELLVVVGLAAVLATLAAPSFTEFRANVARDERVQSLVRTLRHARAEALARGLRVVVCPAASGSLGCAPEPDWGGGWLAFADAVPARGRFDAGDAVLVEVNGRRSPRVVATRRSLEFLPTAAAASTATFVICDARGSRAARAVIVNRTGRVRVSARDSSGRPLACG